MTSSQAMDIYNGKVTTFSCDSPFQIALPGSTLLKEFVQSLMSHTPITSTITSATTLSGQAMSAHTSTSTSLATMQPHSSYTRTMQRRRNRERHATRILQELGIEESDLDSDPNNNNSTTATDTTTADTTTTVPPKALSGQALTATLIPTTPGITNPSTTAADTTTTDTTTTVPPKALSGQAPTATLIPTTPGITNPSTTAAVQVSGQSLTDTKNDNENQNGNSGSTTNSSNTAVTEPRETIITNHMAPYGRKYFSNLDLFDDLSNDMHKDQTITVQWMHRGATGEILGIMAVGDVTSESDGKYRFKVFDAFRLFDNQHDETSSCSKIGKQSNPWFMSRVTEDELLARADVQAFMKHLKDKYKNQLR